MSPATEPGGPRCPICGRPRDMKFRPFCSGRCADLDLAKWLGGGYAIPVVVEDAGRAGAAGGEDAEGEDG